MPQKRKRVQQGKSLTGSSTKPNKKSSKKNDQVEETEEAWTNRREECVALTGLSNMHDYIAACEKYEEFEGTANDPEGETYLQQDTNQKNWLGFFLGY